MLKMTNDIMGERLKGLYESWDLISGPRLLEDRLGVDYNIMRQYSKEYSDIEKNILQVLASMLPEKDKLVIDNYKISKSRLAMHEEVRLSRNVTKDNIEKKSKELENTKEERDRFYEENIKMEKRFKELTEELDNNRSKLKQILAKRRQVGEKEIKNCKLCGRDYYESDNYNWSCKKHTAPFSPDENIYWCCGRFGKNAPECTVSKHESRDDEDEQDNERQRENREKAKLSNTVCSSCKEIGHNPQECPRDPNARTNYEPIEELGRIQKIKKDKRRKNIVTTELHNKMIDFIKNKIGTESAFGNEKVSSIIGTETNRSNTMGDRSSRKGFYDLNDIKRDVQFSSKDNLITIQEIYTKDLEKETVKSKSSNRLRGAGSVAGSDKRIDTVMSSISNSEKRIDTFLSNNSSELRFMAIDTIEDRNSAANTMQTLLKSPVSKQMASSTRSRSGSEYF